MGVMGETVIIFNRASLEIETQLILTEEFQEALNLPKVSAKFDLDEISIRKYLPDMRKIVRKTQLPEDFRC